MERLCKSYDLPAPADAAEREWHASEHDAEMRGSLEAKFEPREDGGSRVSVSTALEADGERRIAGAIERLKRALERKGLDRPSPTG